MKKTFVLFLTSVIFLVSTCSGCAAAGMNNYEGIVKSVSNSNVYIQVAGRTIGYTISPHTIIMVNGKNVPASELMPGQHVSYTNKGSKLSYININSHTEAPGFSQPGLFYLTGSLVGEDNGRLLICDESGSLHNLALPSYVSLNAQVGDLVKVYIDDSGCVYSVNKMAGNMQYACLYSGKLSSVVSNSAQINDTARFDNYRWRDEDAIRLPVSDDVKVYKSNAELGNIGGSIGSYAYFVTRMEYGEERIYKVIIQSGYMKEYVDKIEGIDSVAGRVTLPETDVQLSPGTTILKDGKMITVDNLKEDQTVFALLDRMGNKNSAPLLMVLDRQPSVRIVRGKIDSINSTTFDADHVYEIDGNIWSRVSNPGEFYVNDDTYIIDYINDEKLPPDEFLNDRYDRHSEYTDKNFYAVVDGDEVVGMAMYDSHTDSGTANVRFINAKLDSIDGNGRMSIKDITEYSNLTDKWTIGPGLGYVWIGNSLVIKDGRASETNKIKQGSYVYILADENMNAILVVERGE